VAAFVASHPEFVRAATIIQRHEASSGFDNSTFNGLNAFRVMNEAGVSKWDEVVDEKPIPNSGVQS
jgi:catalase